MTRDQALEACVRAMLRRKNYYVAGLPGPEKHSRQHNHGSRGAWAVAAHLILKRTSASRPTSEWNDDDDYDVLADGVVSRIFKANAAPVGSLWMWTLALGQGQISI